MYRIAFIEDQETIQSLVETALNDMADIESFISIEEFNSRLTQIPEQPFDLVLTDLYLPGEDGRDVVRMMIEQGTPIIIITGDQDQSTEAEMLSIGAFDYIRKPLNDDILRHRVGLHLKLRDEQTRVEQAQDQLIQSEKLAALGQLAAGVAHEINNPVGFVTSNANLTKKYVNKVSDALAALEQEATQETSGEALLLMTRWKAASRVDNLCQELIAISDESIEGLERIKDIVKDLKDYAYTGEQSFDPTDLNKHLASTINLLRNEIKYKADIQTHYGDLPDVPCIASQINQVFVNVIVNACHAIPEFGEIVIDTAVDGRHARIRVSDNGVGMPPEVLKKIFDPFYTTKPVGKGTGIGLAITKSIIDRHSGSLSVLSEPGEGTQFEIRLPLEQLDPQ